LALIVFSFFISHSELVGDEITFTDGTKIEGCLVRDEGRVMRVWLSREDFPERSRIFPRDEVERFRIRRGSEWDEHEKIQDLSVTHIELSPPLAGLHGCYHYDETGAPALCARLNCAVEGRIDADKALEAIPALKHANRISPEKVVEGIKLSYEKGERLKLTAHVKNTGFAVSKPFEYRWELNGVEIKKGMCGKRLGEMEVIKLTQKIEWPGGDPKVRFRINPGTKEIAAFNDERNETLTGFAFDYTVTHRRVNYTHEHRNTLGSFSWEDYYQWHLDIMNRLFAESVYPSAPEGITARVRLNRIFYLDEVEDEAIDDAVMCVDGLIRNQGAWHFRDNPADKEGNWWRPDGNFNGCVTEWSLPHELGHQLGLIDYYNFDYHGTEGFPVVGREAPLRFSHFFRHPRTMMHWHGPHIFHELDAEYLNRTKHMPRGAFGDFTFQTPGKCSIQVLDVNSRPLADAEVKIFQRGAEVILKSRHDGPGTVSWWDVKEENRFEPRFYPRHPVITGKTDSLGMMELPNRPVRAVRTLNGYERVPNPFGNINVVGQRGLMLALVMKNGRTNPFFIELTDFNLACTRGHKDSFVMTLKGDYPSEDSPPSPAAVRLDHTDKGKWRMHWNKPHTGKDTTNSVVHRFRIYRRTANEGLNFDPWDPVATVDAGCSSFELPGFLKNPSQSVGGKRFAYGISSVNERGVESGITKSFAPQMERIIGLVRGEEYGPFYLCLEGEIGLVKLGTQGVYEDFTPVNVPMNKAGGFYAINAQGKMVSTAWDRHGLNLYEKGMKPTGGVGEPFAPGSEPGRFRHPRGCAIDSIGNVAVADGDNRRVQLFAAGSLWNGRAGSTSTRPACVIESFEEKAFDCKTRRAALGHGLLLVYDERGRLYGYSIDHACVTASPRFNIEIGGRVSMAVESEGSFLLLNHDRAWIRRYDANGALLDETDELGKEKLKRPRGLVLLHDKRIATFQDLNRVLIGRFPRKSARAKAEKPLPGLEGVYTHPLRYEHPVLKQKILVLNYDPLVPGPDDNEVLLTKLKGWQDPRELTRAFQHEIRMMSGGYVDCEIAEWIDIDGYPQKPDGFVYNDATYINALNTGDYHHPDIMDYDLIAKEHFFAKRVSSGEIDEVWVWGGPGFGYYESRMYGPGAYWCNSTGIEMPESKRLFVVMGFNYERGLAEMIHDMGHRLESVMSKVYENDFGPWAAEELRSDWERFSCVDHYINGFGAVGNCHFPCNGQDHYDYANPQIVLSSAADWLDYPDLIGKRTLVSREMWEEPGKDYHLGYMRWLFSHLPRAPGTNHEGKLCNWWNYLYDMSTWPATR